MDLVGRLKEFLSANGISVTQFADSCNIPRPTVSQIINGRNKKISDEIISKIHQSYPSLSVYWLMFGEGDMIDDGTNPKVSKIEDEFIMRQQLFKPEANIFSLDTLNNKLFKSEEGKKPKNGIENSDYKCNKKDTDTSADSGRRTISRIVVFYNDNSFESFAPSSSSF